MNILHNTSIRHKQMFAIMLTSSAALLLACAAVVVWSIVNFRTELVKDTKIAADVIGRNSTAAIDFDDSKTADETLAALRAKPNVVAACVYNHTGRILSMYQRDAAKMAFAFPQLQADGHEFKNGQLNLFHTIVQNGEPVGTVFIVSDLKELSQHLIRFAGIVGIVFAGSLLLALVLSSGLQRLISRPIMQLAQVARAVAAEKNYSLRATREYNDEVGLLVDGFNEMLAQIQERDANLERRVEERTRELQRENSERKRAEEAVHESQALYHSLVEQLPAGIFRKDSEGRFAFVNSWFCRLKNLTPGQMLGKTPQELAVYELQKPGRANLSDNLENRLAIQGTTHHEMIMTNGRPIQLEEQYPAADGQMQYFQVVKSAVFGHDGKAIGSQGMLFDITQRKQIEAKLAQERELLRALMDSSPDKIYFKDTSSRFVQCSQAMAEMFGVKGVNELIGKTDSDFFDQEHAGQARADEETIMRTSQPMIGMIEKEVLKDGREMWAITSKMPLHNKAGDIVGTFGISKDITAIKEAEAKLNQVHRQLLDASRQAGMAEVATSVLHNVGNVLNSVNVSSSLIADMVRNSKIANLAKAVTLMRDHEYDLGNYLSNDSKGRQLPNYLANLATHLTQEQEIILRELASLVSNIIHIKEIVSMQQNYAKSSGVLESLKVTDLVEDAIRMNNGAMSRHQVKITREFADVPPILTEKHKVLQILINLIRNAKYACDDSGRDDKQIALRVANGDGRIKISVVDNGIGIPVENLTRIFSHGFTTRKEGHGFGLHSGALAAKELGGALTVVSEGHNRGATFILELPVKH